MSLVSRTLFETTGLSARLSFYAPGERMAAHAHDFHQVSWLLSGEMREGSLRSERDLVRPSIGVKPAGLEHANDYGPNGTLILALNIGRDADLDPLSFAIDDWRWTPRAEGVEQDGMSLALTRLVADQGDHAENAVWDLLALSAGRDEMSRGAIPAWLDQVRAQLRECGDELDMAAVAREAGVHRVSLSRAFSSHFGMPPSLYRARCRVARAIVQIASGTDLADAAADAGFADQSHFSRLARRETGLSPRQLQQVLRAA